MQRSRSGVLAAVLLAGLLTGCSASVEAGRDVHVEADDLSGQVKTELTKTVGQEPDSVVCPDDLAGEKGATTRCTLSDAGKDYGVTVTTTAVEGKKVSFDIEVDQQPKS